MSFDQRRLSRRKFVLGASSVIALSALPLPGIAGASAAQAPQILSGKEFDLHIGYQPVNFTGRERIATTVNNSYPAPTLHWREGDDITIRVTNHLKNETSIHWHGIILPTEMDGVPGLSFAGIQPGETFVYTFKVQQSGTYWYHSHSNFQEQIGLIGSIIIEPKESTPFSYDRDMVVMLSDWSDEKPQHVYANLKRKSDYYNFRERTFSDTWNDFKNKGLMKTWSERSMWNQMRMSQTDISDVTGYTYTYLMNGATPANGWIGLFKPGEKLRLRIINGSGMSIFDVRIPGLKMTVVAADGQDIQPVVVDEFRIGTAEVYDVIVEPDAKQAYTLFAQTNDRTGFARGTLTADPALIAQIPAMDAAPFLTHREMAMPDMTHDAHKTNTEAPSMNHSGHDMGDMSDMDMSHMDHSTHDMSKMENAKPAQTLLAKAGFGSNYDSDGKIISANSGVADPGIGLREHMQQHNRRVLTYADIRSLKPTRDKREPTRDIELHLTGNMHRYMWSIDGQNFMQAAPLRLNYGERVRIILINDTMMTHPIHLHGMWSELETGDPDFIPRKHTVIVQPGSSVSYLVTADAYGRWAFHCHLIYHMPGMMREVRVV